MGGKAVPMAERDTADRQLQRLLYLLPAAQGEGVSIEALATRLDTEPRQILRDLEEVTGREYYHPAGAGEDIQVAIGADRVRVWTKGELRRPLRLTPREALALGLGLRSLAAEHAEDERREAILATAARLERELARAPVEELTPGFGVSAPAGSPSGFRARFTEAIRARRPCRIDYVKPGDPEPEPREVEPYVLALGSHSWYLIAHCRRVGSVRVFRLDRILAMSPLEGEYEIAEDFDPRAYLEAGRVYRADEEREVVVRYGPRVARWMREYGEVEECQDGGVMVRHRVADPHWLARHVLRFGPDAEVIDPPEIRQMLREAAERAVAGSEVPG
jgi:predicted DNA-binding transcriptional regulator YafY